MQGETTVASLMGHLHKGTGGEDTRVINWSTEQDAIGAMKVLQAAFKFGPNNGEEAANFTCAGGGANFWTAAKVVEENKNKAFTRQTCRVFRG